MSVKPPDISIKDFSAILKEMEDRIPYYTPEWKPGSGDPGMALVKIAAHMLHDIKKRFNRVPLKQFLAFLDTLGIAQVPPTPARVLLTFFLAEGTTDHVLVKKGTVAFSEDVAFNTRDNLFVTPAVLNAFYQVEPENDAVYRGPVGFDVPGNSVPPYTCFTGDEQLQSHILYLAHDELFNLRGEVEFKLSPGFLFMPDLRWEYWGELVSPRDDGEEVVSVDWHPLESRDAGGNLLLARDGSAPVIRKKNKGEILEREINGRDGRWIRCLASCGELNQTLSGVTISKPPGDEPGEEFFPDMVLFRRQFMDIGSPEAPVSFYPFGKRPAAPDVFYFASREAFSKKGAEIRIRFLLKTPGVIAEGHDPEIRWEYWNGKVWRMIPDLVFTAESDGSLQTGYRFECSGTLGFVCPGDIKALVVEKEENYWIRARITAGDYDGALIVIPPTYAEREFSVGGETVTLRVMTDPGSVTREDPNPPELTGVFINYGTEALSPGYCFSFNNLNFRDHNSPGAAPGERPFVPFLPLEDEHQTFYFGFDRKIIQGPIRLFFDLAQRSTPGANMPELHWYYSTGGNGWRSLNALDNTMHLTRSGIVELFFPDDFRQNNLFAGNLFWLKIVDVNDNLKAGPVDEEITHWTVLNGIYLNTTYALQSESASDVILGSSDGNGDQEFSFPHSPLIEADVWINEGKSLTEADLAGLLAERGEDCVRQEKDNLGKVLVTWVKWEPAEDFFYSSSTSRHYVIDRINGRLYFGNGNQGKVPPPGEDNIKAAYTSGGGGNGNLPAGSITDLQVTIPYVAGVYNFLPAEGGADVEKIELVMERGPQLIKHRDRAVSREDFEQLAATLVPGVARTKCLLDKGKVRLMIIPELAEDKPQPALVLLDQIKQELLKRSTALLESGNLEVLKPDYREVIVTAEIVPVSPGLAVPLARTVKERLKNFLHPLRGGELGKGWEFGRDVHISDVYAFIENIEGVDHLRRLVLSTPVSGPLGDVVVEQNPLEVRDHETVCSGEHIIIMKAGD